MKDTYVVNDIEMITNVISLLSVSFPKRGQISIQEKSFMSKEKEVWICECKKINNKEISYCSTCNKNIYGFKESEVHPDEIKEKLLKYNELLKGIFKN